MDYPIHQHASFAAESRQEYIAQVAKDAEYAPAIPSPTLNKCDHVEELSEVEEAVQRLQVVQHCLAVVSAVAGAHQPTSLEASKAAHCWDKGIQLSALATLAGQSQQLMEYLHRSMMPPGHGTGHCMRPIEALQAKV